jgi:tellurite methyltransferase
VPTTKDSIGARRFHLIEFSLCIGLICLFYVVETVDKSPAFIISESSSVDNSKMTFNHTLMSLREQFGNIDIYLFDQLLRDRVAPSARVLDAGCGIGRNAVFLLRSGYEVFAADEDPYAIRKMRDLAHSLAPDLPQDNFRTEPIEAMSFPHNFADLVICSAVLHFARDEDHFMAMLRGAWSALACGGLFFCRLASTIGMESQMKQISGRRFLLPDGSERFLVDEEFLLRLTETLGGRMLDPLKTTVVQNERCMTTWVLRKL